MYSAFNRTKVQRFSSTNPAITHNEMFPEIELLNVHTYIKLQALENNNSNHSGVAISRAVNGDIFNSSKWSISESEQGESSFLVTLRWVRKKHEVVDEKKSLMHSSKHVQLHNP